jgi:hypothetical protein
MELAWRNALPYAKVAGARREPVIPGTRRRLPAPDAFHNHTPPDVDSPNLETPAEAEIQAPAPALSTEPAESSCRQTFSRLIEEEPEEEYEAEAARREAHTEEDTVAQDEERDRRDYEQADPAWWDDVDDGFWEELEGMMLHPEHDAGMYMLHHHSFCARSRSLLLCSGSLSHALI